MFAGSGATSTIARRLRAGATAPAYVPRRPTDTVLHAIVRDPRDERDGWVLAVTYEGANERSRLCVFDARAIEKGPIARIPAPAMFPYGFHGAFVPAG